LLNKNKRSIIILCYQYLLVALYLAFVAFKLGVCSFMTGFNLAFVALYLAFCLALKKSPESLA
jgi:O-antigen ligase